MIIPFRGIERENGLERVEGKAEREREDTDRCTQMRGRMSFKPI